MIERQELYCHECKQYVQFDMDLELNGNHVLTCPKCGHEHCRVVLDGKITDDRWDQRNSGPAITISTHSATYTPTSTFATYMPTNYNPTQSWTVVSSSILTVNGITITNNVQKDIYLYGAWMDTVSTGK